MKQNSLTAFYYFLVPDEFLRTPEWLMTKNLHVKGYQFSSHEATIRVPRLCLELINEPCIFQIASERF